jgi:hypothetical protein
VEGDTGIIVGLEEEEKMLLSAMLIATVTCTLCSQINEATLSIYGRI